MGDAWSWTANGPEQTTQLGTVVGRCAPEIGAVGLVGDLGAGKTHFTRGFVEGAAPDVADWVSSPTYAICNTYPGANATVHHLDLYRLRSEDDLESVGFWELLEDGVVVIEWPDRIAMVMDELDLVIRLQHVGADARTIVIESRTDRGRRWSEQVREHLA